MRTATRRKSARGAAVKVRNVLVSINIQGASGRDCLSGILQKIRSGMRWRVHITDKLLTNFQSLPDREHTGFDGIITEKPSTDADMALLDSLEIPVVFTNYKGSEPQIGGNFGLVQLDNRAIGATAARFLDDLGRFRSWAFVTTAPDSRFSVLRERGFRDALAKKGIEPVVFTSDADCERIKVLPKPIAIFAAWDYAALAALNICERAEVRVPDQAVVLGVDNDDILCLGANPALSSIMPDHIALGKAAVLELQRMMGGRAARRLVLKKSVREIVVRDSTRPPKPAEHLIRRAMDFIAQHAEEPISVDDVVRHMHVSRPLADRRFRELQGESIGKTIAKARVAAIKKRLKASRSRLEDIARACGFTDSASLSRYFHRESGITPRDYRNQHRSIP